MCFQFPLNNEMNAESRSVLAENNAVAGGVHACARFDYSPAANFIVFSGCVRAYRFKQPPTGPTFILSVASPSPL